MFNHADEEYKCPICLAIQGVENDATWIKQADIFYRDELVLGFISSKFIEGNEGHPLIVPIAHVENLYDLPSELGGRVLDLAKRTAIALKEIRTCDGVTTAQFNEPAGDQHAFHYHMHVIPRFTGDNFHEALWKTRKSEPEERVEYARKLREWFAK
ncbi:MAG: HIT family protein [Patescibacteria group bacterium]|jgi:histidine triad (HIT) family protein